MVKGSVTISIEDFQAFLESSEKQIKAKEEFEITLKELQVFLSFLCTREDLSKYLEEFNRQSKTAKISIENGRAKIQLKEIKGIDVD